MQGRMVKGNTVVAHVGQAGAGGHQETPRMLPSLGWVAACVLSFTYHRLSFSVIIIIIYHHHHQITHMPNFLLLPACLSVLCYVLQAMVWDGKRVSAGGGEGMRDACGKYYLGLSTWCYCLPGYHKHI